MLLGGALVTGSLLSPPPPPCPYPSGCRGGVANELLHQGGWQGGAVAVIRPSTAHRPPPGEQSAPSVGRALTPAAARRQADCGPPLAVCVLRAAGSSGRQLASPPGVDGRLGWSVDELPIDWETE